jgi:hypothetical protein
MYELNLNEIENVDGGLAFLLMPILFKSVSLSAGGMATALGVGTGLGVIIGGSMAVLSD